MSENTPYYKDIHLLKGSAGLIVGGHVRHKPGAGNDGFIPTALNRVFTLSRALVDL